MRANLAVLAISLFLTPVETVAQSQPLCLVVGHFENHDIASEFSAIVSARGLNASTFKFVNSAGSSWWIVQVGPYSTVHLARNARIDVTSRLGPMDNLALILCDTGEFVPATHR
jgi:hypothetical protein